MINNPARLVVIDLPLPNFSFILIVKLLLQYFQLGMCYKIGIDNSILTAVGTIYLEQCVDPSATLA